VLYASRILTPARGCPEDVCTRIGTVTAPPQNHEVLSIVDADV
jgi:hypothetical protein